MEGKSFSFSDVSLNNESGIKTVSTNSLVAKVKNWNKRNCPGWMLDMMTADEPPSNFSVGECWAELVKRSQEVTVSTVKNQLEVVSKNNGVRFCVNGDLKVVKPDGKEMIMVQKQGYFLKPSLAEQPVVKIEVAIEAVLDVIKGNIKRTNEKNLTVEFVDEDRCKAVKAPYMNFQSKFFSSTMQRVWLFKEMESGIRTELLTDFDKYAPGIYDTQSVAEVKYDKGTKSVKVAVSTPKISSWSKFYSYLAHSRAYRGADGCVQANCSVGYYVGCVSDQYYRMYVTVSNICRLGHKFKTRRLELTELKADMTMAVVKSLACAGWSIRVIYDSTKPVSEKTDDPGVYRHIKFGGVYLKYFAINDTPPVMNSAVYTPSVGIDKWKDAVQHTSDNVVLFSTIYSHDGVFRQFGDFLEPSSSAHTGQILVCSHKTGGVDSGAYVSRCVSANVYKNYFIYTRELFFLKDPFKVDFDVFITPTKYTPVTVEEEEFEVFAIRNNPFQFTDDDVQKAVETMAKNKVEEKKQKGVVVTQQEQVSQIAVVELQSAFNQLQVGDTSQAAILTEHQQRLAQLEGQVNDDADFF